MVKSVPGTLPQIPQTRRGPLPLSRSRSPLVPRSPYACRCSGFGPQRVLFCRRHRCRRGSRRAGELLKKVMGQSQYTSPTQLAIPRVSNRQVPPCMLPKYKGKTTVCASSFTTVGFNAQVSASHALPAKSRLSWSHRIEERVYTVAVTCSQHPS